jgi:hypothetical protein
MINDKNSTASKISNITSSYSCIARVTNRLLEDTVKCLALRYGINIYPNSIKIN